MKKIVLITSLIALAAIGAYFAINNSSKSQNAEPLGEAPEYALPLEELPDDYLDEISMPQGSSVAERLAVVERELHTGNSGDYVRQNFGDLEYLFSWPGPEGQQRKIFPFFYYYSAEADTTFVICNINKTVAICQGRQKEIIEAGDECQLARPFAEDFL